MLLSSANIQPWSLERYLPQKSFYLLRVGAKYTCALFHADLIQFQLNFHFYIIVLRVDMDILKFVPFDLLPFPALW